MTTSPNEHVPMSDERRDEIAGILENISPWPWKWDGKDQGEGAYMLFSQQWEPLCQVFGNGYNVERQEEYGEYDHVFIQNAPEHVSELLEENARLRSRLSTLTQERDGLRAQVEVAFRRIHEVSDWADGWGGITNEIEDAASRLGIDLSALTPNTEEA